jgi:hypothetical protein
MQASKSQILFSYLPGAVFRHEDGAYGRVVAVEGDRLQTLNEEVVYQEIARYVEQWSEDHRQDLPLPTEGRAKEYRLISPEIVRFDLFPLVFECVSRGCGRVRSFTNAEDLARSPRCKHCNSPLRQLRFYSAHNCGLVKPMYVAKCSSHAYEHITFQNTGSFNSATWRCAGPGCNGAVVSRTNQSPCNCKSYPGPDLVVRMRAHPIDDNRAYKPHYIDLVNIDEPRFRDFQAHTLRASIAAGHYIGTVPDIAAGLREAERGSDGTRMTAEQWEAKAQVLRLTGVMTEEDIAVLKQTQGPAEGGLASLAGLDPRVLEDVTVERRFLERAAVFDRSLVQRVSLAERQRAAVARGDSLAVEALDEAQLAARSFGIHELAVTWEFPIAKVAFAYSRESTEPNEATLRGFRSQYHNDGKYPVFSVATETEALLVTLSAADVLAFLHSRGEASGSCDDEAEARKAVLSLFADETQASAHQTIKTLTHTLSHLLLRGIDDGQIGFAEATLAEWIVPTSLTFAIYANTLKDFTLGSLWTLLNNRALQWLLTAQERVTRCENDPLCYQQPERACERCCYLTFGCREFNNDLDRRVLFEFLTFMKGRTAAGAAAVLAL